jgi:hypothetical protein
MAIQSLDNLIAAISAGKTSRFDWNKITGAAAYTAGRWYEMLSLAGSPVATAFPGTALNWVSCSDATGDGTNLFGIPHGGNVSTDIKHLLNMAAWSTAATGVPAVLQLVDVVGYVPGINMNVGTLQSFVGSPTLTRYPNGDGLRMFMAARATTGATPHNIAYSYTNQAGTSGRANPVTVAATVSAIVPHIIHSGVAANNYGPFLPLASGDYGIRNVASITLSAGSGSASTAALVLCKPLAQITLGVAALMTEKDLLNQIPSLPQIKDGACIGFLLGAGANVAAATTFAGQNEHVWG